MYSEEETELRDLIMQNLENCGFLNKIKAELRAGVFLALEEDGNLKTKIPLCNQKFDDFINTPEGKLIISLVREFLEFYSLNFTMSVFEPETASSTFISRTELCDRLNLKASDIDGSVMVTLLKSILGNQNQLSSNKSPDEISLSEKPSKPFSTETDPEKINLENFLKDDNPSQQENLYIHNTLESNSTSVSKNSKNDFKDTFKTSDSLLVKDAENCKAADKTFTDIFQDKDNKAEKDNKSSIFKESNNLPSSDPFFDEPLPSEKPSFFALPESLKEKSESKLSPLSQRELDDSKKNSLSSLRDLPSLTGSNEWTFNRDAKNVLPSLDSLKSVSSSEASNEEVINLDLKQNFEKKDSDIAESNEESSEKQNSEESIEEEIEEEDFSAGFEDLLNSSLSLADDVTTDQTVSQVSVVEGVDHVEPCK